MLTVPYIITPNPSAALYQMLYLSSSLLLPPVESGSSHVRVTDVLVEFTTLTLRGGEGGSGCFVEGDVSFNIITNMHNGMFQANNVCI